MERIGSRGACVLVFLIDTLSIEGRRRLFAWCIYFSVRRRKHHSLPNPDDLLRLDTVRYTIRPRRSSPRRVDRRGALSVTVRRFGENGRHSEHCFVAISAPARYGNGS